MKCQICGSCSVPIREEIRWCQTCGALILLRGCTPVLVLVAQFAADQPEIAERRQEFLMTYNSTLADLEEIAEMARAWEQESP